MSLLTGIQELSVSTTSQSWICMQWKHGRASCDGSKTHWLLRIFHLNVMTSYIYPITFELLKFDTVLFCFLVYSTQSWDLPLQCSIHYFQIQCSMCWGTEFRIEFTIWWCDSFVDRHDAKATKSRSRLNNNQISFEFFLFSFYLRFVTFTGQRCWIYINKSSNTTK